MSDVHDSLVLGLQDNQVRIYVEQVFNLQIANTDRSLDNKGRSIGPAKSLNEFYVLVKKAIDHYEKRAGTPEVNKVIYTEEDPDIESQTETISFSLIERLPGAFAKGAPMEAKVRNQKPLFREEVDDPENPGYRLVTVGYWHDNMVRFTCWARTNKAANARALWFETMMEEYTWWFKHQGLDRVIFQGRGADITAVVDGNNKWYGRPLDYFVRTETLKVFSEKTLEELIISVGTSNS